MIYFWLVPPSTPKMRVDYEEDIDEPADDEDPLESFLEAILLSKPMQRRIEVSRRKADQEFDDVFGDSGDRKHNTTKTFC